MNLLWSFVGILCCVHPKNVLILSFEPFLVSVVLRGKLSQNVGSVGRLDSFFVRLLQLICCISSILFLVWCYFLSTFWGWQILESRFLFESWLILPLIISTFLWLRHKQRGIGLNLLCSEHLTSHLLRPIMIIFVTIALFLASFTETQIIEGVGSFRSYVLLVWIGGIWAGDSTKGILIKVILQVQIGTYW